MLFLSWLFSLDLCSRSLLHRDFVTSNNAFVTLNNAFVTSNNAFVTSNNAFVTSNNAFGVLLSYQCSNENENQINEYRLVYSSFVNWERSLLLRVRIVIIWKNEESKCQYHWLMIFSVQTKSMRSLLSWKNLCYLTFYAPYFIFKS